MSRRPVEDPIITPVSGVLGGEQHTHPAYGSISASRVSGQVNLYGSDFTHNQFITVRISKAYFRRDLSTDWPSKGDDIVEVMMSEAQWATFVSSLNVGSGVNCTLHTINGRYVPELPAPKSQQDTYSKELLDTMRKAKEQLELAQTAVANSKLSKADQSKIMSLLNGAQQNIGTNLTFVGDCFGEYMENTTEKAKIEVNAYITQTIARAGLDALTTTAPLSIITKDDTIDN